MNDEVTMNVEAIANRISDELFRRKERAIISKLYAKCDQCGLCFKINELVLVERDKLGELFKHDPSFLRLLVADEPVRLMCLRCLEHFAELGELLGPQEQVGMYAKLRPGTNVDAIEHNTGVMDEWDWRANRFKLRADIAPSTHMRDHWAARKRYG